MANSFISLTPSGKIGSETIANVFWYAFDTGVEDEPSNSQLGALIDDWIDNVQDLYTEALPDDYNIETVTAKGWQNDGTPGEVLAVVRATSGAGTLSGSRDGIAHVVKIAYGMGDLIAFSGSSAALRTSRTLYGPLVNAAVDEDGSFIEAGLGSGNGAALLGGLTRSLTIAAADDASPIRVTHVDNHIVTPNVIGYRPVTSAFFRLDTSFLRRRMNQR